MHSFIGLVFTFLSQTRTSLSRARSPRFAQLNLAIIVGNRLIYVGKSGATRGSKTFAIWQRKVEAKPTEIQIASSKGG